MEEQTTEDLTKETQADESQLNSAAGDKAESVDTGNLSLADLNKVTGLNFKDKETALKSIKDMQSQAGKAADLDGKLKQALEGSSESGNEELTELKERLNRNELELFYSNNPQYRENKELLETIAKANSMSPQEAAETDLFKNTVSTPQKRTVADSNNRVASGAAKDFDPKAHAGDANAMADHIVNTYFKK